MSQPGPDLEILGVRAVGDGTYLVTLHDGTAGTTSDFEVVRRGGLIPTVTVSDALMAAVGEAGSVAESARLLVQHLDTLSTGATASTPRPLAFQDAVAIAHDLVRRVQQSGGSEVVLAGCTELPTAWAFGYQSLIGNGPVVVPKDGSTPWYASSATPVESQVAAWAAQRADTSPTDEAPTT